MTPGRRLYSFVTKRARGDDYRGHLGLISTVRKDFLQLNALMKDWRHRRDRGEQAPLPIDRIVLYIDDLDRCSPRLVDVLQAVHLLLALDLFVVVVGVDPRWLLRSLQSQYDELLTRPQDSEDETGWQASPQDYLEKIFNIPFVLPEMSSDGYKDLISGLASEAERTHRPPAASAAMQDAAPAPEPDAGAIDVEPESEVAAIAEDRPPDLEVRAFTDGEMGVLAALAPLVATPREAKRLVNIYRLIRSTRDLGPSSTFLGAGEEPGEYQAVAILLGLLSSHGRLLKDILAAPARGSEAPDVLGGLVHREPDASWEEFVAGIKPVRVEAKWSNAILGPLNDGAVASWRALHAGLVSASEVVELDDLVVFQRWAPQVARFSFVLSAYSAPS